MRSKAPALRDRRFRITLEDLNGWAFIAVAMAVFIVMTVYPVASAVITSFQNRSEEHTSELQSQR